MSSGATMVMLLAMVLVWGGLLASIIHLMKNPDVPLDDVKD